jgi:hypothetical protein
VQCGVVETQGRVLQQRRSEDEANQEQRTINNDQ